jgi:hypothetical protein
VEAAIQGNLGEQTCKALATLTPREEQILRMRFGIGQKVDRTLEEVGKQFAVTRERIRQIEAKALRKLRQTGRSRNLEDLLAPRPSGSQLWWTELEVRRLRNSSSAASRPVADYPVVGFDQFQECAVRILEAEELGSGFIAEADYHRLGPVACGQPTFASGTIAICGFDVGAPSSVCPEMTSGGGCDPCFINAARTHFATCAKARMSGRDPPASSNTNQSSLAPNRGFGCA